MLQTVEIVFCLLTLGVECDDGSVIISENYWMEFRGGTIVSAGCPSSFCCQLTGGCDYVEDELSLCARNRDAESPLCGKCIDGFSESMNSEKCMKCNWSVHWEYLLVPLLMILMVTPLLLFANRWKKDSVLKRKKGRLSVIKMGGDTFKGTVIGNAKRLKTGDNKITLMSLAKIVVYYEQALSQMFSATADTIWGVAIAGFFDFSSQRLSEGVSDDDDDWCFIDGLNAKFKIILDLIAPVMICLFLLILFIASRCILRRPIIIKKKEVNFESVALGVFLLMTGKVLDTLFKVLSCQSVGTQSVHFYFGFEACYGTTWIVALSILVLIIVSFGSVFIYGRRLTVEQRADRNMFIFKLSKRFKPEYWYWEFVIFVRRLIIALFAVGIPGVVYKLVFLVLMTVFIGIQVYLTPFVSAKVNQAEFVLLCALPTVITAQSFMVLTDYSFPVIVLSFAVFLPIPLVMWFVGSVVWAEWKQWVADHKEFKDDILITRDIAEAEARTKKMNESNTTMVRTVGEADYKVDIKEKEVEDSPNEVELQEIVSDTQEDVETKDIADVISNTTDTAGMEEQ